MQILSRLHLILMVILFCSACNKNSNPVDGDKTYTLEGNIYYYYGFAAEKVSVHLAGDGIDTFTSSDTWGRYSFSNLSSGKYTIKVSTERYFPYPDSLQIMMNKDVHADDIYFIPNEYKKSMTVLLGKVLFSNSTPVPGVNIIISRAGSTSKPDTVFTNANGYYAYTLSRGEKVVLLPERAGYSFSFVPEKLEITADQWIIPGNFTASGPDMRLHSISGRLIDRDGSPINGGVRLLDATTPIEARTDSEGSFFIPGMKDGTHTLFLLSSIYIFPESQISVLVKGGDTVLPDMIGTYNGPTTYALSGKAVNQNGEGISDATIRVRASHWVSDVWKGDAITRPDGTFLGTALTNSSPTVFTFKLSKAGCIIKPDSVMVTVSKIDGKREGGSITIPSFTGYDYTINLPADYFPLRSDAPWTYARTILSAAPVDFTARISGVLTINGYLYFQFNPSGPAGLAYFRVAGNSVRAEYGGKDVELLRFGALPGVKWDVGKVSDTYPITGTFLGLESVTVPAGTWPDCLKYEVRTAYGQTSHETCTLWFAQGTGMVKSEKTLVNYGAVKEKIVDELK